MDRFDNPSIMRVISTIALIGLIQVGLFAQERPEMGLKFGYYFNNSFYVAELVDGIHVRSTEAGQDGWRVDFFIDHQLSKKIVLSGEVSYLWNIGTTGPIIQIENIALSRDSVEWLTGTFPPSNSSVELSAKIRFKLTPFMEPFIGGAIVRFGNFDRFKFTPLDLDDIEDNYTRRFNYQNELIVSVENSYKKYALMSVFGIRFNYRKMILDVIYDKTITPVSRNIKFQGVKSPFNQQMDRMSVMIGYKF